MAVRLENLTRRPVLLELAGGRTLRLAPGRSSGDLAEIDVEADAVQQLLARGVVALHPAPEQAPRSGGRRARRGSASGQGENTGAN